MIDLSNRIYVEEIQHKIKLYRLKSEVPTGEPDCLSLEDCLERDVELKNFFGGVEVPIDDIYKPYDEELNYGAKFHIEDNFMSIVSLDGTKALIRCCTPIHSKGWSGADWETVKKFASDFNCIPLTKSAFQDKIDSEEYKEPVEEIV